MMNANAVRRVCGAGRKPVARWPLPWQCRQLNNAPPASTLSASERAQRLKLLQQQQNDLRRQRARQSTSVALYALAGIVAVSGLGYAAVPLYRAFCQKAGISGTINPDVERFTPDRMVAVPDTGRRIRVSFNGDVSDTLNWTLRPQQREVSVLPGETALAFFTATNRSDQDITGIATYTVTPGQVAEYFSKVACFCFEEQRLNAGESVDMPVFFFLDPEYAEDPRMRDIDHIVLSYTFFRARYDDSGALQQPVGSPMKQAILPA